MAGNTTPFEDATHDALMDVEDLEDELDEEDEQDEEEDGEAE